MDYGTGAVFGCPAHDQRDLEFARAYGLPVIPVVLPPGADPDAFNIGDEAYTGDGTLFNSDFLDGLSVDDAKEEMARRLSARDAAGSPASDAQDRVPLARLGHLAAALLGMPDPDDPLRELAASCRCRPRTCRSSCRRM